MEHELKKHSVEATQWQKNGDHPLDYANEKLGYENGELRTWTGDECREKGWEGQIVRYFRDPHIDGDSDCALCDRRMHNHGWIDQAPQNHIVCPGDFVVTDLDGSYFPMKPGQFLNMYEPAV